MQLAINYISACMHQNVT